MSAITYTETGHGFPVILIHGFCESRAMWDPFLSALPEGYRYITPDLPGFGESALPEGDFTIDDIAESVAEWLEQLEINTCIFIGHSLGGYVALSLAKYHSDKLAGIGLFHSTAYADDEAKKDSRSKTITFVEKHGVQRFADSFVEPLFHVSNRKDNQLTIVWLKEIVASTDQESLIQYTKAMRDRFDNAQVLKSFKKPVLIIGGEEDPAVPVEKTMEMAELPENCQLELLPMTGHKGMYERKNVCQQVIAEFIGSVAAS